MCRSIHERLHRRNIAAALLPFEDAGEGNSGWFNGGVGVELQPSALADAPVLAGKGEPAEQVRPDRQPVKPCLLFGGNSFTSSAASVSG
jgi:hypothetical protein